MAEEAALNKASVEQAIALRPSYAESEEAAKARIKALGAEFLPAMTNDDLDRYITGLLQRNGLVAESLLISASADETTALCRSSTRSNSFSAGTLSVCVSSFAATRSSSDSLERMLFTRIADVINERNHSLSLTFSNASSIRSA